MLLYYISSTLQKVLCFAEEQKATPYLQLFPIDRKIAETSYSAVLEIQNPSKTDLTQKLALPPTLNK